MPDIYVMDGEISTAIFGALLVISLGAVFWYEIREMWKRK